jgi:hypothetical protein
MARIAVVVLRTLILLVLIEGAARVAEWIHPAQEELSFAYAPYRMLKMSKAPWPLNRDGFRAREWSTYRDSFLIEFLGGSVCLGVGTNPGLTVPERLERTLRAAGMPRTEVVNLCQGGATTAQEFAIFVQFGLPLEPQVVLSFDGANDLMHPKPIGEDDAPNLPYRNAQLEAVFEGKAAVAREIATLRVASRLLQRMPPISTCRTVSSDSILQSYFYTLGLTRTLAESRGATYSVIFQPTLHFNKPWNDSEKVMWLQRRPHDPQSSSKLAQDLYSKAVPEVHRWAARTETTLYDLTDTFSQDSQTVYSDSVHFIGDRGYAALSRELERQGLIQQIAVQYRKWERRHEASQKLSWAPQQ